jgi:hypothetical protein
MINTACLAANFHVFSLIELFQPLRNSNSILNLFTVFSLFKLYGNQSFVERITSFDVIVTICVNYSLERILHLTDEKHF